MKRLHPLHLAAFVLALYGCEMSSTVEHVERVVQNDPGGFTVYARDEGGRLGSVYYSTSGDGQARVIADVPSGRPMWAEMRNAGGCKLDEPHGRFVTIHVHSLSDVEGVGHGR